MRLETARLVIRTFDADDAQAWIAMVSDPEVRRFVPPGPLPTMETFQGAIQRRHEMERERGYAVWAIDAKETGLFVGQCGLQPVERTGPETELAYHFNKESWNKGYATEATIAVLAHGFHTAGLDEVIALVIPENVGSCRVAEKAGMRLEGTATYYGIPNLRKYVAQSAWWTEPSEGSSSERG